MKLKSLSAYAVGLFVGLAQMTSATAQTTDYSSYYKNLPINQPQVSAPVIPTYEIKITDFGGVNDGVTLNTEAFAKAMAHLASKGGGRSWFRKESGTPARLHLKTTSNFISNAARWCFSAKTSPTIPQ